MSPVLPFEQVWMLANVISSSPFLPAADQATPTPHPPPTPPLVTLRPEDISTPPFVWLAPGVLATYSGHQFPPAHRHHWPPGLVHAGRTSTMSVWEIAKFVTEQKTGQVTYKGTILSTFESFLNIVFF